MSEEKPQVGTIMWQDLTVQNAEQVRDFYSEVVGWKTSPFDMGGYDDYNMSDPASDKTVAGICHARGEDANIPPQWLIYITVADVDESVRQCIKLGGKVIDGPRPIGDSTFCVIQDPAGAVAALIS